jgi:hypothetical protein
MGTSVVLINSDKGKKYFELASKRINYEEAPLEWAVSGNHALVSSITRLSNKRNEFFDDLDKMRFDALIMKYKDTSSVKAKLRIVKKKIKKVLKFLWIIIRTTRLTPSAIYKTIRYSGIKKLIQGKGIICGTNSHIKIDKSSKIEIEGLLVLGRKTMFPRSKDESKLFVGKNARLRVDGRFDVDANCEIVVFESAELIIRGGKYGY